MKGCHRQRRPRYRSISTCNGPQSDARRASGGAIVTVWTPDVLLEALKDASTEALRGVLTGVAPACRIETVIVWGRPNGQFYFAL